MPADEATTMRGVPNWLVSGVVHLLGLMAVVLLPADARRPPPLRIVGGDVGPAESLSDVLELADFGEEADQIASRGIVSEDALRWLIAQQRADGGWPATANDRRSSDLESTALVMLALLQAGQTHHGGAYRREVRAAAEYLAAQGKPAGTSPPRLIFGPASRPTRTQALVTLALCELYSRTHDKQLQQPAQLAMEQICASQNLVTGGWDSGGGQQADIETATWNLLALKEAHLAYFQVPPANIGAAARWFNQQAAANAQSKPDDVEPGIVLSRCFFGLRRDPLCQAQIERLMAEESSSRTLVDDYFATRVVCEFGNRPAADEWVKRMKLQVKLPRAGGPHRQDIQATALRVLIERSRCPNWRIYGADAAEDDFPL